MRRAAPLRLAALVMALALVAGACGDDLQRPPAVIPNEVDTVSLYALSGTPVHLPSAYVLELRDAIRTDQTSAIDFAFDLTAAGASRLIPTGPLGLGQGSGLQVSPGSFDSVLVAPTRGYVYDAAAAADSGAELLVQSRATARCSVSYYAKLRVLQVDTVERLIRFEILTDANCGYRGLEPGLPTR